MNKKETRICAIILGLSVILSTGCKKKDDSGKKRIVAEDDPYFTSETVEISVPVNPDLELDYGGGLFEVRFTADRVAGYYNNGYKVPQEVQDQINELNQQMSEEAEKSQCVSDELYQRIEELTSKYTENGILIYDLDGHLIKQIESTRDSELTGPIFPTPDGGFVTCSTDYALGECMTGSTLIFLDKNGETVNSFPLDPSIVESGVNDIFFLSNGNMLIVTYMSDMVLMDTNGQIISIEKNEDTVEVFQIGDKLYARVSVFNQQTMETRTYMTEVDPSTGKLGPEMKTNVDLFTLCAGDNGFYSQSKHGKAINKVNIETGEEETILDWNWTDLNGYTISLKEGKIYSKDEMVFIQYVTDPDSEGSKYVRGTGRKLVLAKLNRAEKNPHAGKPIVEIGFGSEINESFMDYVVSYNTEPENKSRLIFRDIEAELELDPNGYYAKAAKELSDKIYLEMLAGEGADILVNYSSFSQFNTDDVLVDLNTYIDGENGLDRSLYFDNVFRAFETNGKMYHMPVCFDMRGYVANVDYVGERTNWSYDEFESIADSLPSDVSMMDAEQYAKFLQRLISVSFSTFIDYGLKKVNFESPEFKKALELSKRFGKPQDDPMEQAEGSENRSLYSANRLQHEQFENGTLCMIPAYYYDILSFALAAGKMDDKAVYIGAPGPSATGVAASPSLTLALSANSVSKDEAWDFIRYMYNTKQQIRYSNEFDSVPMSREALDKRNEDVIAEYNELKESAAKNMERRSFEDSYYNYLVLNQNVADRFVKVIESVNTIECIDPGVMMIVDEEAPGYFFDQRTVEDVCKNIQNRATTLVRER